MGTIKIISRSVPQIGTGTYNKDGFDRKGDYAHERVLVSDNFFSSNADEHWRLYVLPDAAEQILSYIHWGTKHVKNLVEQGGFLLGRYFRDEEKKVTVCLVEQAVPAVQASGTAGYLVMQKADLLAAHGEMDKGNRGRPENQRLRMVGWFHTHPNSLDVFMSGTDRSTQSSMFAGENAVSIVFNPQRKLWKCFRSDRCQDVKGEILLNRATVEKLGISKVHNRYCLEGC